MPWAPDYVTSAELKAFLRIPAADVADDTQIAFAIAAASRAIDRAANRQFGLTATAEARVYTARYDRWRGRWVIDVDDFQTLTGLAIAYDDNDDGVFDKTVDVYRTWPFNADEEGRPWTTIIVDPDSANTPGAAQGATRVTAFWGWSAVPATVKQATFLQASRFFQRRGAPFGVAGSPDVGSELRLLSKVDPDVEVALGPYRRWWAAV
jgi:hypothetical protein